MFPFFPVRKWLRVRWLRQTASRLLGRAPQRTPLRRPFACRPFLEPLEDRTLLTLNVTGGGSAVSITGASTDTVYLKQTGTTLFYSADNTTFSSIGVNSTYNLTASSLGGVDVVGSVTTNGGAVSFTPYHSVKVDDAPLVTGSSAHGTLKGPNNSFTLTFASNWTNNTLTASLTGATSLKDGSLATFAGTDPSGKLSNGQQFALHVINQSNPNAVQVQLYRPIVVSTSSATGAAGSLTFDANNTSDPGISDATVTLGQYDQLLATGNTASNNGTINTTAEDTVTDIGIFYYDNFFGLRSLASDYKAIVSIGQGAVVTGGAVTMTTTAGNSSAINQLNPVLSGFVITPLEGLFNDIISLPLSVLVKSATAKVEIGANATITSSDKVTVTTRATSNSSGEATYWAPALGGVLGASFAYDQATSDAESLVDSGATINAGSSVTVSATTTTTTSGTSRVTQNTGTFATSPNTILVSVAFNSLKVTTHAIVSTGALINAPKGNVSVTASATDQDKTSVQTASYHDGFVGLTGSLGFVNADVQAYVDGAVIAGGANLGSQQTTNPFQNVDFANSRFVFSTNPGYTTGQELLYSSGLGGAIPGLTTNTIYYAIVSNSGGPSPSSFYVQLAASQDDATAATPRPISFGRYPTLNWTSNGTTYSLPITNLDTTSHSYIRYDFDPGFVEGQTVTFAGGAGQFLGYDTPVPGAFVVGDSSSPAGQLVASDDSTYTITGNDTTTKRLTLAWQSGSKTLTNGEVLTFSNDGANSGSLTDSQSYAVQVIDQSNPSAIVVQLQQLTLAGSLSSASNAYKVHIVSSTVDSQHQYTIQLLNASDNSLVPLDNNPYLTTAGGKILRILAFGAQNNSVILDTASLGGITINNADALTYHAGLATAVSGLIDNTTYYAIVDPGQFSKLDPNNPPTLQLAANQPDAVAANPVLRAQNPTLTWTDGNNTAQTTTILTVEPALADRLVGANDAYTITASNSATNTLTVVEQPGYTVTPTEGELLTFQGSIGDSTHLQDNHVYSVHNVVSLGNGMFTLQLRDSVRLATLGTLTGGGHSYTIESYSSTLNTMTIALDGSTLVANPLTEGQALVYTGSGIPGSNTLQNGTTYNVHVLDQGNAGAMVVQLSAGYQVSTTGSFTGNGGTFTITGSNPGTSTLTLSSNTALHNGDILTYGGPAISLAGYLQNNQQYTVTNLTRPTAGTYQVQLVSVAYQVAGAAAPTPPATNLGLLQGTGLSYAILSSDSSAGILTLALQNSSEFNTLSVGQMLTFVGPSGSNLASTLQNGRTYSVAFIIDQSNPAHVQIKLITTPLNLGYGTLSLGSNTFVIHNVDPSSQILTVAAIGSSTGLVDGNQVTFNGTSGSGSGFLQNGQTYSVTVVNPNDPNNIQIRLSQYLLPTYGIMTDASSHTLAITDSNEFANTVTLSQTGAPFPITEGETLTYHGASISATSLLQDGHTYTVHIVNNSDSNNVQVQLIDSTGPLVVDSTSNGVDPLSNAVLLDSTQTPIPNGTIVTYHAGSAFTTVGGLQDGVQYKAVVDSANPTVVHLSTLGGQTVQLTLAETLQAGNTTYHIIGSDALAQTLTLDQSTGLSEGEALTYQSALGASTGSLLPGSTYYVHIPNPQTPTVIQLTYQLPNNPYPSGVLLNTVYSVPNKILQTSNVLDLQSAIDLGDVDQSYMSGSAHTLTPVGQQGITISATLSSSDSAKVKSAIGGPPRFLDVLTKGELAPQFWNIARTLWTSGLNNNGQSPIEQQIASKGNEGSQVSISGSFVYEQVTNSSYAEVGPDAVLASTANIAVTSTLTENNQTSDDATIAKPALQNLDGTAKTSLFNLAIALDLVSQNNTSHAQIDGGAVVDATDALTVTSRVNYPFVWQINNPNGFNAEDWFGKDGFKNLSGLFDGKFGLQGQLINNWADSGIKGGSTKVSISGSLIYNSYTNDNEARIDSGALINQNASPIYRQDTQTVSVDAETTFDAVNFVGNVFIDLTPENIKKTILRDWGNNNLGSLSNSLLPGTQASLFGIGASVEYVNFANTTTSVVGGIHTFDPSKAVNSSAGTIDLGYNHHYSNGQELVYSTNGGNVIKGLVNGQAYYAIVDSTRPTQLKLAASYALAQAGTALPLDPSTATGSFQSLQPVNNATQSFDGSKVASNKIALGYNPGFTNGEAVVYDNGGGVSIKGNGASLGNGTVYYAIVNPSNLTTLQLALTLADALAGKALTLTAGSGTKQSFKGLATQVNFGIDTTISGTVSPAFNVSASQRLFDLNLGTSGGAGNSGGQFAFNGTFAYFGNTSTTIAQVGAGTDLISNPTTSGKVGSVNVSATDSSVIVGLAAQRVRSENVAGGVSGILNNASRTTAAIVGNDTSQGTSPWGSNWNVTGNVTIDATETGTVIAAAISFATTTPKAAAAQNGPNANPPGPAIGANWGISISGDASLSLMTDNTYAYVNDPGTFTAGKVTVTALDKTVAIGLGGAFAFQVNVPNSQSTVNVAVGGSYSQIDLSGSTAAFVQNASVSFQSLTVHGERDNFIGTLTANVAQAEGPDSFSIAGSVSIDLFTGDTNAFLNNVSGNLVGDLDVTARDDSILVGFTGALGSGTRVGLGLALSYISFTHNVRAYASATKMTMGGQVDLEATDTTAIGTLGISGGTTPPDPNNPGRPFIAGAGNFSIDQIRMTLDAHIDSNSRLVADGGVTVKANDGSYIVSISGGLALDSSSGSAAGAAISYNLISNTVKAYIDSSTVQADGGALLVTATSTPVLVNLSAGLSFADEFSLGGSISLNSIANNIQAYVINSNIVSSGDTTVQATESAVLVAIAGAVGVAAKGNTGAAVAAAIAYNYVGGQADPTNPDVIDHSSGNQSYSQAYIDSSTVSVGGKLTVAAGFAPPATLPSTTITQFASGDPNSVAASLDTITIPFPITTQLVSLALGGTGADNFALGGSLSLSFIRETIHAGISNSTSVTAKGAVTITALDSSSIGTLAGAVAVSLKTGSVGASIDSADIANDLMTYIENSTVSSTTDSVSVISQEKAQETNIALSGGGGEKFALGGSVAVNVIDNGINAHISRTSNVTAQKNVQVSSSDTAIIGTGVGQVSIAVGATSAAVGASVVVDDILNTTRTYFDASTVTATTGNVQLAATSSLHSTAVAVGGDGSQTFSLGGSVVVNYIGDTTGAQVTGGSKVTAATGVSIQAQDTSTIGTGAGQVTIAIGTQEASGAVGAAIAVNVITTNISAYVDNSAIQSGGGVSVAASSSQSILGVTVGLGGSTSSNSFSLSLVGSGVGNYLSGSTQALIQDNSTVTTTNNSSVSVQASNASTLQVGAGVIGFTLVTNPSVSGAVGISAATNTIGSSSTPYSVLADIDHSTVTSASGVSVAATSTPSILAVTVAGTGSGATGGGLDLSGAGAGSGNTINSSVQALIKNGSTVSSGNAQAVSLTARDLASINADAGGITLGYSGNGAGGTIEVGAALAINSITDTVQSNIDSSTVTSAGDLDLAATTETGLAFDPKSSVSNNTITFNNDPHLQTGDPVIYSDNGGAVIGGLTNGHTYYAIVTNNGTSHSPPTQWFVQLASNLNDAHSSPADPITLNPSGAGPNQSLTYPGQKIFALALGIAGALGTGGQGPSGALAGAGSGTTNQVTNKIDASITNCNTSNNHSITTQGKGAVNLSALNHTEITAASGSLAVAIGRGSGAATGAVGIGLAINTIGTASSPGSVTAIIDNSQVTSAAAVSLDAESYSSILAITMAAAGAGSSSPQAGGGAFDGAGAGSGNTLACNVEALIEGGSTVMTGTGSTVALTARDNSYIQADAGGLSLGIGVGGMLGGAISIGAAVAIDNVTNTIEASIIGSTVTSGGDVDLLATTQTPQGKEGQTIFTVAVGVAGSVGRGSQGGGIALAGAGSGSGNSITNMLEASIKNSTDSKSNKTASNVTASSGQVNVTALDGSKITAGAGSLGLSLVTGSQAGVAVSAGVAAAANSIGSSSHPYQVTAAIEDSTVKAGQGVTLDAESTSTIYTVTIVGGLTVSTGNENFGAAFGVAGAGSQNVTYITTQALIEDGSTVTSGNGKDVSLTARNSTTITSDGGGVSLDIATGQATLAIGIGAGYGNNVTSNTTTAGIDHSTVTSAGKVSLTANATSSTITATAFGIGVAFAISSGQLAVAGAGSGAGAYNTVTNTDQAYIQNGSNVTANATGADAVNLSASDTSQITANSGAGSLAVAFVPDPEAGLAVSLAVSAVVSNNTIGNTVRSSIGLPGGNASDSTVVNSSGGVELTSTSGATIDALGVAVSTSFGISFAGAGAGAQITNTIGQSPQQPVTVNTSNVTTGSTPPFGSTINNAGLSGLTPGQAVVYHTNSGAPINTSTGALVDGGTYYAVVNANNPNIIQLADSRADALAGNVITFTSQGNNNQTLTPVSSVGMVTATIQNGARVNAGTAGNHSAVELTAKDTSAITSRVGSGAGSIGIVGGSVDVSLATNSLGNQVSANITGATVTTTGGDVDLTATATDTANGLAVATSASLTIGGAGGGGNSTTTDSTVTQAYLGAGANVQIGGGTLKLLATSMPTLTAETDGGTGGIAAIGAVVASAIANETTQAFIGEGVTVNAGNVSVDAESNRPAGTDSVTSKSILVDVGVVGVTSLNTFSTISDTTAAFIGPQAGATPTNQKTTITVSSGGTVLVTSNSTTTATSKPDGGNLGDLVSVTVSIASTQLNGSTNAYLGGNLTLNAGTVNVSADSTNTAVASTVASVTLGSTTAGGANISSNVGRNAAAYVAGGATVNVPGGVLDVSATSKETTTATCNGGSGGGVSVYAVVLSSQVTGNTQAYVGEGATVTAGSLTVEASADDRNANTKSFILGISVLGGAGSNATASIGGLTEAYVGPEQSATPTGKTTTLTVSGDIQVTANSFANPVVTTTVGSGGAIASASAAVSNAQVGKTGSGGTDDQTLAYLGPNTVVASPSAPATSLTVKATIGDVASSTSTVGSGGILNGDGTDVQTNLTPTVKAWISTNVSVYVTGVNKLRTVSVDPAKIDTATDTITSPDLVGVTTGQPLIYHKGTGNGILLGALNAPLQDGSVCYALVDPAHPGQISLAATPSDALNNNAIDLTSAGDSTDQSLTIAQPELVGVDVEATSLRAEGHASGNNYGGGGLQVGIPNARTTSKPVVTAWIDTSSTIVADGDVKVLASCLAQASQVFNDQIQAVNTGTSNGQFLDQITFPSHGLITGNQVVYAINGDATPIKTPVPDINNQNTIGAIDAQNPPVSNSGPRIYNVIAIDENNLQLGNQFTATKVDNSDLFLPLSANNGVDPARDEIRFAAPHLFQTGDALHYDTNGGNSISTGMNTAGTYYVRVIDPYTIKLYPSYAQATASFTSFDPANPAQFDPVTGTFKFLPSGFSEGTAVTYLAPPTETFRSTEVVQNESTKIYQLTLPTTNLQTGEYVTYNTNAATRVTPVGGLNPGQKYYVRVIPATKADPSLTSTASYIQVQFYNTYADAINDQNAITLTPHTDPASVSATEELVPVGITGLTNGVTYYLTHVVSSEIAVPPVHTFQLAATKGGPIITGLTVPQGTLGPYQIGLDGIAMDNVTNTAVTQDLHIAFSSPSTSKETGDELLAPTYTTNTQGKLVLGGVSLRQANPPQGSGQLSSSAEGGNGGGLVFDFPYASTTLDPTVTAYVAPKLIQSGGNVTVASESIGNLNAYTSNNSGGFLDVSQTKSVTNFGESGGTLNTSQAFVGKGDQPNNIDASGVTINAAGQFILAADTQLTTTPNSNVDGGGFIKDSEATAQSFINSNTSTTVGSNAHITASTVNLTSTASKFNITVTANATAYGFAGIAKTFTDSKANSNVLTQINSGTTAITGQQGVDVRAQNQNFQPSLKPHSTSSAVFIPFHDTASQHTTNNGTFTTNVQANGVNNGGATIVAGPRPASTPLVKPFSGFTNLALYVQAQDSSVSGPSESRTIAWNANVTINSSVNPYLVIDSTGKIVRDDNVVVQDGEGGPVRGVGEKISSGTAVVNDITNTGTGQAYFVADDSASNTANNPYPLFNFDYSFGSVTILNSSNNALEIHKIDVVDASAIQNSSNQTDVQILPLGQPGQNVNNIPFFFRIAHTTQPTLIDIENQNTAMAASNINLTDVIMNPIGQTIIHNARGSIEATTSAAAIWTNNLDLQASVDIGSLASRIVLDLIASVDTSNILRPIIFSAVATTGSMYLDLTGRYRGPTNPFITSPFVVPIKSLTAGGDINLTLEDSWFDPAAGGAAAGITVGVNSSTGPYVHFFHPDSSGPNGLDPGVFVGSGSTKISITTYDFQPVASTFDKSGAASGAAGLTAGGNILVAANNPSKTINVVGTIDLTGSGYLDTTTNGSINYGEGSQGGTMRVHVVQSTADSVMLTVPFLANMTGQDLDLIKGGNSNGLISALTKVLLQIGDNMTTDGDPVPTNPAATMITAGTSITIIGDYGNSTSATGSTITVNGALSSPTTNIKAGSQNDTVTLNTSHDINSQTTSVISNFTNAVVNVDGQQGTNALKVSDATYQGQDSGVLTNSTLMGLGMGGNGLTYTNIQNLEVDLSRGNLSQGDNFNGLMYFAILSTQTGCQTLVQGGAGDDTIVVASDANVPADGPLFTNGTLANILGPLTIDAMGGTANRLIVSNSAANVSQTVTVTSSTIGGFAPVLLTYQTSGSFTDAGAHDGILLVGSNVGGNTFNVQSTLGGSTTSIQGGGGASDIFNISSTASGSVAGGPTLNGNAQGIAGDLEVVGGSGAANRLVASDYSHSSSDTVTLTDDTTNSQNLNPLTHKEITGLAPANLFYSAAGSFTDSAGSRTFDGILLLGPQAGGNTFNVQSTLGGSTTQIQGDGGTADYFNIYSDASGSGPGKSASSSNVLGILGPLSVIGGTSTANRLLISDKGDDGSHSSNLKLSQIILTDHSLLNFAPAFIYYSASSSGGMTGNFTNPAKINNGLWIQGSLTASNTFLLSGTLLGSTNEVDGGAKSDSFNFGAELVNDVVNPDSTDPALPPVFGKDQGDLNSLQGLTTVVGNGAPAGGGDSLEVNDHGPLYLVNGVQQYATDDNGNPVVPALPLHTNDDGVPATQKPAANLASDPHYQYTAVDPAYGYNYFVTPNLIANDTSVIVHGNGDRSQSVRSFAGIAYNTTGQASRDTVKFVRVDGTDRTNRFTVTPSQTAAYLIDGNMPDSSARIDGGDYLNLDTSHLGNTAARNLHIFSTPYSFYGTFDGKTYYPDLPAGGAGLNSMGQPGTVVPGRTFIPATPGVDSGELSSPKGNGFWDFILNGRIYARSVFFLSIEQFNHVAAIADGSDASKIWPGVVNVRDAETGRLLFSVKPYPSDVHGGVRVAMGDVNGDGIPDLIVAPGPGYQPLVEIFNGSPDAIGHYPHVMLTDFNAFSGGFKGGVTLAVGDVNGDGRNDLIVGAGPGWLPQVRVFDGNTLLSTHQYTYFDAFASIFRGGVTVAAGDINNDGYAEIVVGRGAGEEPQVNVYDGKSYAAFVPSVNPNTPVTPRLVRVLHPFSTTLLDGVWITVGDFNGDGVRDIIVGAGAGWLPMVRVFSGVNVYSNQPVALLISFLANSNFFHGGVRVATAPTNGGNSPSVVSQVSIFMGFGANNNPKRNIALATWVPPLGHSLRDWVIESVQFAEGIFVG
jgi:hypothetical protein